MIKNYLLPHVFKKIGLWSVWPFLLGCIYLLDFTNIEFLNKLFSIKCKVFAIVSDEKLFTVTTSEIFDEIFIIGLTVSLLFIGFSKEKREDEMIGQLRLQSIVWGVLVSSVIFILGTLFIYQFSYISFAFIYPFLFYILFICKFNYEMFRLGVYKTGSSK